MDDRGVPDRAPCPDMRPEIIGKGGNEQLKSVEYAANPNCPTQKEHDWFDWGGLTKSQPTAAPVSAQVPGPDLLSDVAP